MRKKRTYLSIEQREREDKILCLMMIFTMIFLFVGLMFIRLSSLAS